MDAQEQVERLVSSVLDAVPVGSTIRLAYIKGAPRVQKRVAGADGSQRLIDAARDLRTSSGMPFWHALFLAGERSPGGVPNEILRSALYHQDPNLHETVEFIYTHDVSRRIAALAENVQGRDSLGLLSRVTLPNGEDRYIPMLDFTSKSSRIGSEATVRAAIEVLDTPGQLFSSARSYHFYGSILVTEKEQLDFWSRALLLTPIVDERWIAHQMRAQIGALRISANERGIVPQALDKTRSMRAVI